MNCSAATAPKKLPPPKARYHQTQATLEKYERGNRREDIAAAQSALAYDEARFRERQVLAPAAATVEVLDVRPGDLIAPNTPVATLLERDQIYVRIYIPETRNRPSATRPESGDSRGLVSQPSLSAASSSRSTSRPNFCRATCRPAKNASTRFSA